MTVYRLITGKDDASFCHRITALLARGWQLHGPPTITFNAGTAEVVCGQAITKEVEGVTYDPGMDLAEA